MSVWKETIRRLEYLRRRAVFDDDLDAEVRFHIEAGADELEQAGMPRREALLQARREFGPPARMREETRSAWQFRRIEDLASDLRYAARSFRRNPAFAVTAIACLALGIGANTTMFSIAAEALFSKPSSRDTGSLVLVDIGGNSHSPMYGYRFLRDAGIFAGFAGDNENAEVNWRHGDATDRLVGIRVTGDFFDVIGIPLAMGRPIQPRDTDIVVISYGLWKSRLGGDPAVIGRGLILDGHPFTVAGVLTRDHRTVNGFGFSPDLYLPAGDEKFVAYYARLAAGVTPQIAAARVQAACQELDRIHPKEGWTETIHVVGLAGLDRIRYDRGMQSIAAFFAMLMVAVGLVLLIACANVASLLLARAFSRSHEFAIRLSIGAGRGRIIRQLFAESLLLSVLGTAAGLALNLALTSLVNTVRLPLPIPVRFLIAPDWRLLGYATAVALVTSIAAGLLPAIKGTRASLSAALKSGDRQTTRGSGVLRNALVGGQLAVSIVLLCAAFLFMRNLVEASTRNPGFDIDHTIWASMRLVPEAYPKPVATRALVAAAVDRLRNLPGVEAAAFVRIVPLNDAANHQTYVTTDVDPQPTLVHFNENYVTPGYFKTMRIPILQGREFQASDRMGAPPVAIVNENLARRLFGRADATGHVIRFKNGQSLAIAGVARNSKYVTLGEANVLAVYQPFDQWTEAPVSLQFLVRGSGAPAPLVAPIHAALNRLDPAAALEVKPMQQGLAFALMPSRVGAVILGSMGLLGLALASIGLYGVLLYAVSRRMREIGLRVALGATPGAILRLVMRQSLSLTGAGMSIGLAISVFAVRPLAMFLSPEVRTTDITNFLSVAVVLSVVALAATVSPALRALRVDPVEALRHE